jgi:small-conductance mechanosensitive channel
MLATVALGTLAQRAIAQAAMVADSTTTAVRDTASPRDTATLVLAGRPIAVFRAPLGASTPRERATAAAARFAAAVRQEIPREVAVTPSPAGLVLSVGTARLFVLTPDDLERDAGVTLATTAAASAGQLRGALGVVHESRSIPLLLRAAGLAVLATLGLLLALRVLVGARRALVARLPEAGGTGFRDLHLGGFTLLRADQMIGTIRRIVGFVAWLAGLLFAYLWLVFVLTSFAYSRPWGEALGGYLTHTVKTLLLEALRAVPGLFTVVLIIGATRWIARLVRAFFDAVEARSVVVPWVHPETANPTRRLAVAMLWLLAIVVAYPYMPGSGSDVFKGVSVFAGLVLSLGSSGVMNQAMSGLVLMYSRALRPGDYVQVGEEEGVVVELGMLSTKIRTNKRELVTLPNAVVAGARVKNYSRLADQPEGVLLYTSVTIGYDTPWRQVEGMLLLAASRTRGLRSAPEPFVLVTALSDFYLEYQLNVPMEDPRRRPAVLSELHAHIADVFNEFGVQITSPHYVADPPVAQVIPRSQWRPAPAAPDDSHRPAPVPAPVITRS